MAKKKLSKTQKLRKKKRKLQKKLNNNISVKESTPIKKEQNKSKQKKDKPKNKVLKIFLIFLILVLLSTLTYSGYKIIEWKKDSIHHQKEIDAISNPTEGDNPLIIEEPVEEKKEETTTNKDKDKNKDKNKPLTYEQIFRNESYLNVDFNRLKKINSDTVAWLKVNGTNINYPVLQTTNNTYYLTHTFDETSNVGGWIFMDYRNSSNVANNKNTIIYGHSMEDGTMFESLKNIYNDPTWFKDKSNHVIKLSTKNEMTLWQVFSVYTVKSESYYITTKFYTDSDYLDFLKKITSRSKYNFNQKITTKNKILTLSSCYGDGSKRIVVHAKLIKIKKN